jgi:hypothetical protein
LKENYKKLSGKDPEKSSTKTENLPFHKKNNRHYIKWFQKLEENRHEIARIERGDERRITERRSSLICWRNLMACTNWRRAAPMERRLVAWLRHANK